MWQYYLKDSTQFHQFSFQSLFILTDTISRLVEVSCFVSMPGN